MTKITYLLGAGASCGIRRQKNNEIINKSLPLVDEIPSRLDYFITQLKILLDYSDHNSFTDQFTNRKILYADLVENLIIDFDNLSNNAKNHASIDTFAKKTFLYEKSKSSTDFPEFRKIKQLIDLYFILEQYFQEPDLRYDLFISSIANDIKSFIPESINILSWNYDFQIDASFSNFIDDKNLNNLNSFTQKNIFRLNGISGGHYFGDTFSFDELKYEVEIIRNRKQIAIDKNPEWYFENLPFFEVLEKYHYYINNHYKTSIKFAWENNAEIIDKIIPVLNQTNILVIIGYSFPTFNRSIDKIVISNLHKSVNIYLQVPSNDFETIKTKIDFLSEDRILEQVKQVDILNEFFIPYEFDFSS